jgi:hypothetical protein
VRYAAPRLFARTSYETSIGKAERIKTIASLLD